MQKMYKLNESEELVHAKMRMDMHFLYMKWIILIIKYKINLD